MRRKRRHQAGKAQEGFQHKRAGWKKHLAGVGTSVALLLSLVLAYHGLTSAPHVSPATLTRKTAAIVDQVAISNPNPEFIEQALSYLIAAGFDADVYEAEDITVDFYRTLPTKGYKLIMLRTHSSGVYEIEGGVEVEEVSIFTSERYSKYRWVPEQLREELGASVIQYDDVNQDVYYFSITPGFVRNRMEGRFADTLFIIAGCQSMTTLDMAEALVERGAAVVVGWNEWVDLNHNDQALERLLQALLVDGQTVEDAVAVTMAQIGPDPVYQSVLTYFPKKH